MATNSLGLSQLGFLPLSDAAFVMDRTNGKWIFLDPSDAAALGTLASRDDQLSDSEFQRKKILEAKLKQASFGTRIEEVSGDLNTLILKLTKLCNYRCEYCYDLEHDDPLSHLSLAVGLKSLEEAIQLARRPQRFPTLPDLTVILHGGEPTLVWPLLKELVIEGEKMADDAGKKVRFSGQTNLSKVTDEFISFSREHRIQWGISLDGPADINDKFRVLANGAGTYSYFTKALAEFPDFVRSCGVLSVVTSANDGQLLRIARHFHKAGVSTWDWSLFQPIGQGRGCNDKFSYSTSVVVASWNALFEAVEAGEFDGFNVRPVSRYLENLVTGAGANMCMRTQCGAARDLMSVSSDGHIGACDCIDRKGPFGNLGLVQIGAPGSLAAARSGPVANLIRSRDTTINACKSCIWIRPCGGTCLAHSPGLHEIDDSQCRLSMNAFTRIVDSLSRSDALYRYWKSIRLARYEWGAQAPLPPVA